MKKPCTECGKDCDIFPIQLGDSFTLTYLRVCNTDCLFRIAYDFLYSIGNHKDFLNFLYDKQNLEDKALRDEFIDVTTKMFLEDFKNHLQENPNLLSTPIPEGTLDMFASKPTAPIRAETVRFVRPSKDERIKWAKDYVEKTKTDFEQAKIDLQTLLNER